MSPSASSLVTITPSLVTILLLIIFACCVYGCCIWEGKEKKDKDQPAYTSIQKTEHSSSSSTVLSRHAISRTPPDPSDYIPAYIPAYVEIIREDKLGCESNSSSELLINNLGNGGNKPLKIYRQRLQRSSSMV